MYKEKQRRKTDFSLSRVSLSRVRLDTTAAAMYGKETGAFGRLRSFVGVHA